MAEYMASIFCTEKDKVNCSFYFKIGACRHEDRCLQIHNKPTFSQTVLMKNLYHNPQKSAQSADRSQCKRFVIFTETLRNNLRENSSNILKSDLLAKTGTRTDAELQEQYDDFYEDVFVELEHKYGEIEEMYVCDNLIEHLIGNVYVKFRYDEDAERAVNDLNNRWFDGRPIYAELSPVTSFERACCRQYESGLCFKSDFCNFIHLKPISPELRRELFESKQLKESSNGRERKRSPSRSRERRDRSRNPKRRDRSRSKERHGNKS